jgi:hypothetical protein
MRRILFCCLLLLSGCATRFDHKYYPSEVNTDERMASFRDESNLIMTYALRNMIDRYHEHGDTTLEGGRVTVVDACVISNKQLSTMYKIRNKGCFYNSSSHKTIIRRLEGDCKYTEICSLTGSFMRALENFTPTQLVNEYNRISDIFLTYREGLIKYAEDVKPRAKNIRLLTLASPDILTSEEIEQFSNVQFRSKFVKTVDAAIENKPYRDVLETTAYWWHELPWRFLSEPKTKSKTISLEDVDSVFFTFNNITFDFVPDIYSFKDDFLVVSVTNKRSEYGYIETSKLRISNTTKNFISINKVVSYYESKIENNLYFNDGDIVSIPPNSTITIDANYPSFKGLRRLYIPVYSRNETKNYGFSVQYEVSAKGLVSDLYSVKKYSMNDFL